MAWHFRHKKDFFIGNELSSLLSCLAAEPFN